MRSFGEAAPTAASNMLLSNCRGLSIINQDTYLNPSS
jgi:hypothetical protein